jgi:hypothetical protein
LLESCIDMGVLSKGDLGRYCGQVLARLYFEPESPV